MPARFIGMLFISFCHIVMAEGLEFGQGWSRQMVPGAPSAVIYGQFENKGDKDLSVRRITSEVAGMAMIHRSVIENGMMKMRHVDELRIPPGESIVLKPGGLHIMLSELKKDLVEKDTFDIRIHTSDGESYTASIVVGSIGQMSSPD